MNLVIYSKQEWDTVAEQMHEILFNEHRPASLNRFDFVLSAWEENDLIGYITCRETDAESVYISYGGIMPEKQKSMAVMKAYKIGLEELSKKYARVNTMIENINIPMLKLAMSQGFVVVGIANYVGHIYLDLRLEF